MLKSSYLVKHIQNFDRKISDFLHKYEPFRIKRSYFEVTRIQVLRENLILLQIVFYIFKERNYFGIKHPFAISKKDINDLSRTLLY